MSAPKPSEVIREARNVLFERGWHQGEHRQRSGEGTAVCAWGALNVAAGDAPNVCLNSDPAALYLIRVLEHRTIPDWNDDPKRTFDEVIDVFDRAEKLAEIEMTVGVCLTPPETRED